METLQIRKEVYTILKNLSKKQSKKDVAVYLEELIFNSSRR